MSLIINLINITISGTSYTHQQTPEEHIMLYIEAELVYNGTRLASDKRLLYNQRDYQCTMAADPLSTRLLLKDVSVSFMDLHFIPIEQLELISIGFKCIFSKEAPSTCISAPSPGRVVYAGACGMIIGIFKVHLLAPKKDRNHCLHGNFSYNESSKQTISTNESLSRTSLVFPSELKPFPSPSLHSLQPIIAKVLKLWPLHVYHKAVDSFLETHEKISLLKGKEQLESKHWLIKLFIIFSNMHEMSSADIIQSISESLINHSEIDASYFVCFIAKFSSIAEPSPPLLLAIVTIFINVSSLSSICKNMNSLLVAVELLTMRLIKIENKRVKCDTQKSSSSVQSRNRSLSILSESDAGDFEFDSSENTLLLDGFIECICSKTACSILSLFWALFFETESSVSFHPSRKRISAYMYKRLLETLEVLKDVNGDNFVMGDILTTSSLVKDVFLCVKQCSDLTLRYGLSRDEELRNYLTKRVGHYFGTQDGVVLSPLDSDCRLSAIIYEKCRMFSSSRSPALLMFRLQSNTICRNKTEFSSIIFKCGDDLRMDALALMLISKSNEILLGVGLDLRVNLYKVLPTGPSEGCIECLHAMALSQLSSSNSILEFLRLHNLVEKMYKEAVLSFIRSSAFYCVLTYVLGIGDRHYDNILLCYDGRVVHIDFSFIFGNDPKISSSEMRLSKDMVDSMGGEFSRGFDEFQKHCCLAYNTLRYFRNDILALIASFVESGVSCVHGRINRKAVDFVLDRFRPELSDEQAAVHICLVISRSLKAILPQMLECAHYFSTSNNI